MYKDTVLHIYVLNAIQFNSNELYWHEKTYVKAKASIKNTKESKNNKNSSRGTYIQLEGYNVL